jgi:hypothetical protein
LLHFFAQLPPERSRLQEMVLHCLLQVSAFTRRLGQQNTHTPPVFWHWDAQLASFEWMEQ